MNKSIWSAACAAVAVSLAASLVAQGTPEQTSSSSKSNAPVTVTGCLQRATEPGGTAGTTGTSASRAGETKFILTNAAPGSSSGSTTGTAGSSAAAMSSQYRLDADDSKLSPHVGHKVEVTGTIDQASSSSGSTANPPSSAGSASSMSAPKLKVDSVRMIASTCS